MNGFDSGVLLWLNQFARRSAAFDMMVVRVSNSDMLKGQIFMLVLWWFWYRSGEKREKSRDIVAAAVVSVFLAVAAGRIAAFLLPFRFRPAFNPSFAFTLPFGVDESWNKRVWSAMPSDHAMLFSALAAGIARLCRRLGAAAFAYSLLVIEMPRLYLGLHHPTDVLAGAALGAALGAAATSEAFRNRLAPLHRRWREVHPSSFYALFIMITFQIGEMFGEPIGLIRVLTHALKGTP